MEEAASRERQTRVQPQVLHFPPYVTLERLIATASLSFTKYRMGVIYLPFTIFVSIK